jgi:hypothetical protein
VFLDLLRQPGGDGRVALTNTFAGIRLADAPGFVLAQLVGLGLALPLLRLPAPWRV